jgi:hypothetical protein
MALPGEGGAVKKNSQFFEVQSPDKALTTTTFIKRRMA